VATVDNNGLITGIARGTATITATATDGSNRRSMVRINVATMVKGITVSGSDEVAAGRNVQLTANVTPYDATNKRVMWSSSDNSIATVSSNGRVNARNVDDIKTVTISATAMDGSGVSASKTITVKAAARDVSISHKNTEVEYQMLPIDAGSVLQLAGSVLPEAASQEVTWRSSSPRVATVNDDGTVKGIARGTAYIYCTSADGTARKTYVRVNVTY
ncbi:MAG: Ig-like domain-containing protein, partial [Clostridia bacterium]